MHRAAEMLPAILPLRAHAAFQPLLSSQHLGVRLHRRAPFPVPDRWGKTERAICTWSGAIQGYLLKYACSFSLGMLRLGWGVPRGLQFWKLSFNYTVVLGCSYISVVERSKQGKGLAKNKLCSFRVTYIFCIHAGLSPEALRWEGDWEKARGRGRVKYVLSELKSAHPFGKAVARRAEPR